MIYSSPPGPTWEWIEAHLEYYLSRAVAFEAVGNLKLAKVCFDEALKDELTLERVLETLTEWP